MSDKEKYAVGVDLGGTSVKLGIISLQGKIIKKTAVETKAEDGPESVISQIKYGINILLHKNKLKIHGIGIGSPGTVNIKKGIVENPPNFPGWKKINLGKIIKKEFDTPVRIDNDAHAAATGEMIFGAGKNIDSFMMITLGTGVGGGIVFNRRIFGGSTAEQGRLDI